MFRGGYGLTRREKLFIRNVLQEDFEWQYGGIDYRGKKVLDIGADVGSTADFFLKRGANLVIAVEASPVYWQLLKVNVERFKRVVPVCLKISRPEDVAELILKFRPDVAKVDCEGCEVHLFNVDDYVFSLVPEYVVETHSDIIFEAMAEKCSRNNYVIYHVNEWKPQIRIAYARSRRI